jgi:Zn-dependent protease
MPIHPDDFRAAAVAQSESLLQGKGDPLYAGGSYCLPGGSESAGVFRRLRLMALAATVLGLGGLAGGAIIFIAGKFVHFPFDAWAVGIPCSGVGMAILLLGLSLQWRIVWRHVKGRMGDQWPAADNKPVRVGIEDAATHEKLKVLPEDMAFAWCHPGSQCLQVEGLGYRYLIYADDVLALETIATRSLTKLLLRYRVGSATVGMTLTPSGVGRAVARGTNLDGRESFVDRACETLRPASQPVATAVPPPVTPIAVPPQLLGDAALSPQDLPAASATPTPAPSIYAAPPVAAAALPNREILAELDRLQNKKASWGSFFVVLVVSAVVFVGVGKTSWSWPMLGMLMGVLLIHELGHYLAMLAFGYKNLRLFFIPLFGAAVSGRHYNVPGWKKVIVSLMGPVPGIAAGVVLGVCGIIAHQPMLIKVASLALIINGLNLLPVLPLDGGWVAHALLFSRHYLLDVIFRAVAGVALIGGGVLVHDKVLPYVGGVMLLGLPASFRLARIVRDLRLARMTSQSTDDQTIPPPVASVIIDKVKASFPSRTNNKTVAQYTLQAFEALNARPPGWAATLGLGAVHLTGIMVATLFAILFIAIPQGNLGDFARAAAERPKHNLVVADLAAWNAPAAAAPHITLIATFPKAAASKVAYDDLTRRLPPAAALENFGSSLLVTLPANDDAARRKWLDEFKPQADVLVDGIKVRGSLSLQCIAPDEATAEAIVQEANAYFRTANLHCIAPWSADDTRTPAERQAHLKARQTYVRVQSLGAKSYLDPTIKALHKQMAEATKQGDEAETTRLAAQIAKADAEFKQRQLDELRHASADEVDQAVVERYLAIVQPYEDAAATQRGAAAPATRPAPDYTHLFDVMKQQQERQVAELGPMLGQLPLTGSAPSAAADRWTARWGMVSHTGLIVTFHCPFQSVFDGAPAMVRWLGAKKCSNFYYDFGSRVEDFDD